MSFEIKNSECCSVCLEDDYKQNNKFICNHPLCHECYNKLNKKLCPICRSDKINLYEPKINKSLSSHSSNEMINFYDYCYQPKRNTRYLYNIK